MKALPKIKQNTTNTQSSGNKLQRQVKPLQLYSEELQPKLQVGRPGDKYEQEAKANEDRIMKMGDEEKLQPKRSGEEEVRRKCSSCGEEAVMQKGTSTTPEITPEFSDTLNRTKGRGEPLSEATRESMGTKFNADFSNVRIHTGTEAAGMNKQINAKAFTHGSDIYFNRGTYDEGSSMGKRLLAHELTHVVQQEDNDAQQNIQNNTLRSQVSCTVQQQSETERTFKKEAEIPKTKSADTDNAVGQFPPNFDPQEHAQKLYDALEGWGTDERVVLDILWTGRRDMTRAIEVAYNNTYRTKLETRLHEDLSGPDLRRALILLGHGKLDLRDKVREIVRDAIFGEGFNDEKLFNDLDRASKEEIKALDKDQKLRSELQNVLMRNLLIDEWNLVTAYLQGKGVLAKRLKMAVNGWGTDEKTIWKAVENASPQEREELFSDQFKKIRDDVLEDLSDEDDIRFMRMLEGNLSNLDRIEMAATGWGTDESGLTMAITNLTSSEYELLAKGLTESENLERTIKTVAHLEELIAAELSGNDLAEAQEILHQKKLAFNPEYREKYLHAQEKTLIGDTLTEESSAAMRSVLVAQEGKAMSIVGRLKVAAAGAGTDEKTIWHVLNQLTIEQRQFIAQHNPESVLDSLKGDLSDVHFKRALAILQGGAGSVKAAIRQAIQEAIEGWGVDKRLLYDAIDRALKEGVSAEILADPELDRLTKMYLMPDQHQLFRLVLYSGEFTPIMRLKWATTAMAGTDEDLVFELCKQYGSEWFTGSRTDPSVEKANAIDSEVNKILESELSTRDYWKAIDLMRGEPTPDAYEERLARAKEMLERERGEDLSAGIMDALSFTGENADDAWREYKATYNQALEDDVLTDKEKELIRRDERYSKEMTAEYREAKATIAQWITTVAVAIVGVVATILTAGAAGPFVLALGGKALFVAEAMVAAAVLKVGFNRAIQGEGYDATSTEALVDAVAASVEVGLSVAGGQLASRFMQGLGKTSLARSVGPAVEKAFGKAGNRILAAGLEGSIDATIGGVGEGVVRGMAYEETWSGGIEGFFKNMGESVGVNSLMSGVGGFIGGAAFKSFGEVLGPRVKSKASTEAAEVKAKEPTTTTKSEEAADSKKSGESKIEGEKVKKNLTELKDPSIRTDESITTLSQLDAADFPEPHQRLFFEEMREELDEFGLDWKNLGLKNDYDVVQFFARHESLEDAMAELSQKLDEVEGIIKTHKELTEPLGIPSKRSGRRLDDPSWNEKVAKLEESGSYGKLNEEYGRRFLENNFDDVSSQVYIEPLLDNGQPAGFYIIVDNIGASKHSGKLYAFDAKLSSQAPLTINQTIGYPMLSRNGGIVRSRIKTSFPYGMQLGPTPTYRLQPRVNLKEKGGIRPTREFFKLKLIE